MQRNEDDQTFVKPIDQKRRLDTPHDLIGVSTYVDFNGYKNLKNVPARTDSGARTSSLWATDVKVKGDTVRFKMFGPSSPFYTGKVVTAPIEGMRTVISSTGHEQDRYVVKFGITIENKRLKAKFTLSDRSSQVYPILVGRNTLRGNFLVDAADPGPAFNFRDRTEANDYYESEAA